MITKPPPRRATGRHLLAAAALTLCAWASPGIAAPDWDIVGVRLGMTEAEVRAALKAFAPQAQIQAFNASYGFSDGVQQLSSPQFLNTLEVRVGNPGLGAGVKVWFSGPVGEARVIGIARRFNDETRTPSTLAQFEQGLEAKYGKPTSIYESHYPVWEEAGKPACARIASGPNQTRAYVGSFVSVVQTFNNPERIEETVDKNRGAGGRGAPLPADLATCGAFGFYYYHRGDPVKNFDAGIFDVGAMVATERSRNAWVDGLEAEAVRKRQGQGQAPRL